MDTDDRSENDTAQTTQHSAAFSELPLQRHPANPNQPPVKPGEREYLHYRYGLIDDIQHDWKQTAEHFHLSESRAANTESKALYHVRKLFLEKRKHSRGV